LYQVRASPVTLTALTEYREPMTLKLGLAVHSFPGERPVLLVHGFTRSAQLDWIDPGWPPALAAQGRGAIAVDLPGHGSCPATDRDAISVSTVIAGMVAAIDSTGQDEADVVGYSLGARLAWTLAATGRVGRLVLGGLSPTDPMVGVDIELLRAVAQGEAAAPDPELGRLATWISQPGLDRDQTLLLIEALVADAFDPGVDLPTVPTLIVAGTEDDPVDQLTATLPNAKYLTVPGDHFGALMSAEFRAAALDFLG
jgi:pimeloyl-ACP methyl ester carboxylesterase